MLTISNISFSYKRHKPVLENFSLDLPAGGIYGLLGPNGAGKTTLLHLIAGALTPQKGKIEFNDINTRRRLPETLRDIFIVSEEFSLPPISLEKYVRLNAPFYPGFSAEEMNRILDMFGLSADIDLGSLSMGQKKKAFMSFALACNTPLLLLDEPTNGLDIPGKSAFRRIIATSANDERTFIISTHQVRDIDRILDHIIIMNSTRLLLNRSVPDIQDKLKFASSTNSEIIGNALAALPGIGATSVMIPNTDGNPTEIDLELLFDFALKNPGELSRIFPIPVSDTENTDR